MVISTLEKNKAGKGDRKGAAGCGVGRRILWSVGIYRVCVSDISS